MSSPAKGVEAAKCVRVKLLVRVFFGPLSCNDESARDASRNARFSRTWAFIEHWPASGFALRGESYKRPEVFFLIERMRVRTRVDARNEDEKGSLRREQRTGM
jgi:hypothetical protein